MRFLGVLLTLAILAVAATLVAGDPALVIDVRATALVVGVPLLSSLLLRPNSSALRAIADSLRRDREDLPPEQRLDSADRLRSLANHTIAIGLVVMFGGAIRHLGSIAHAGGSVSSGALVGSIGSLLLAPIHAFVIAVFVYLPLAEGLASPSRR